jgi:hypothetical protein
VDVTLAFGNNFQGSLLNGTVTVSAVSRARLQQVLISGGSPGKQFSLVATSTGLVSATSNPFTVKPGPSQLAFSATGELTPHGRREPLGSIQVQVRARRQPVRSDKTTVVRLYLKNNPGGAVFVDPGTGLPLADNPTATVHDGVATFSNVALDKAGVGYTLGVVSTNQTFLLPGETKAFDITPGPASKLGFAQPPTTTAAGRPINGGLVPPGVRVQVLDAFGNVASQSSPNVSVTLKGTTKTVAAVHGIATFTDLSVAAAESAVTLTATMDQARRSLRAVQHRRRRPSAHHLALDRPTGVTDSGELLGDVTVAVQDASNQTVTTDNTTQVQLTAVAVRAGSPVSGYLAGLTTQTVTNGVATFHSLVINRNKNANFAIQGRATRSRSSSAARITGW